jgi:hypothetical protein
MELLEASVKKALVVIVDILLLLFLLAAAGNIALELTMVRPGDTDVKFIKGFGYGITTIPMVGKNSTSPSGSIALIKRIDAAVAQPGDAILCFDDHGKPIFACELDSFRDGRVVVNIGTGLMETDPSRVIAQYKAVIVGGYDAVIWLRSPWVIGSVSAVIILLFIIARLPARRQDGLLSPTDGEISSMFRD